MLTAGVYYAYKNENNLIFSVLPGNKVYPKSDIYVPYFKPATSAGNSKYLFYVNYLKGASIGTSVTIQMGAKAPVTVKTINSNGLFIYRFAPDYGYFTLKVTTGSGASVTHKFRAVDSKLILSVVGQEHAEAIANFQELLGGYQGVQYNDGKILPVSADYLKVEDNFGSILGFYKPADWDADTYVKAVVGTWHDGIVSTGTALGLTSVSLTNFVGFSIDQLSGQTVKLSRNEIASLTAEGFTSTTFVDEHASDFGAYFTWGNTDYSKLYVLFKRGVGRTFSANYIVGISISGRLVVYPEGSAPASAVLRLYKVSFNGQDQVAVVSDYRTYDTNTDVSGTFYALHKGGATGAIQDVIESVTGYRPGDSDLTEIQDDAYWQLPYEAENTWQASTAYSYGALVMSSSGAIVAMCIAAGISGATEPTWPVEEGKYVSDTRVGADNPSWKIVSILPQHYPISGGTSGYSGMSGDILWGSGQVAQILSGVIYANRLAVKIVTDGMYYNGEPITRGDSLEDQLSYSWLNPYAGSSDAVVPNGFYYDQFLGTSQIFTTSHTFTEGTEEVYMNGSLLSKGTDYTVTGLNQITVAVTLTATDVIGIYYIETAGTTLHQVVNVTADAAYLTIPLTQPVPAVGNIKVWYNSLLDPRYLNSATEWYFIDASTIRINHAVTAGDTIDLVYMTYGRSGNTTTSVLFENTTSSTISLVKAYVPASVQLFINGSLQAASEYIVATDGLRVTLSNTLYNSLTTGDVISLVGKAEVMVGDNVVITETLATGTLKTYIQGINFEVNYTKGKIIWLSGADRPATGSGTLVYYNYFPKDILTKLLYLVKPATCQIVQNYFTSEGTQFDPYSQTDWPAKATQDDLII